MNNVFIAVGGSGTKVAEAFIRLLTVGFPTQIDNDGKLTSIGTNLQIWRVDSSIGAGAADDLNAALANYIEVQDALSGLTDPVKAESDWAMSINRNVKVLDPTAAIETEDKSLNGFLTSGRNGQISAGSLLQPFYSEGDLRVKIDKGFYQKPFIGAAVMSAFASALADPNSPVGSSANLRALEGQKTNFFLCGSLHGGTGACGVPVIAKFLSNRRKREWGWRVGGCMLDPYFRPTDPPFKPLDPLKYDDRILIDTLSENYGIYSGLPDFAKKQIDNYVSEYSDHPSFSALNTPEEKKTLVWEILLGYFADPKTVIERARQGLNFYSDHGGQDFDELYLAGKPAPTQYDRWSNGGASQRNPANSAETVAALSAFNFFSKQEESRGNRKPPFNIPGSDADLPDNNLIRLNHLPKYEIKGLTEKIDPEKVFLSTALLHHLVLNEIDWSLNLNGWHKSLKLGEIYNNDAQKDADHTVYREALGTIANSLADIINPRTSIGWSSEDLREIQSLLATLETNPGTVAEVRERFKSKSFFNKNEAKGTNVLGVSSAKFRALDFAEWCPPTARYTKGKYLRHVWAEIYSRCKKSS